MIAITSDNAREIALNRGGVFSETQKDATNAIREASKSGQFDVWLTNIKDREAMARDLIEAGFEVMKHSNKGLFVSWR